MTQMLLIPDPRPLVDRLGADFFRHAPQNAGVYVMRDAAGTVLYVGKAKNLRNRLRSYRVANPDRMPRRHLRLLRTATRIDLHPCVDESAALAGEAELLRALRPRFNRAGTWPGPPRFLVWRIMSRQVSLGVVSDPEGWCSHGPLGGGAFGLRSTLVRLIWCALQPARGLTGMPPGWFSRLPDEPVTIVSAAEADADLSQLETQFSTFFGGHPEGLMAWLRERTSVHSNAFASAVLRADFESLEYFVEYTASKLRAAGRLPGDDILTAMDQPALRPQ